MLKKFIKGKIKELDYPMLTIICILVCLGLVVLASASSYSAINMYNDSSYFWIRQLGFAVVGIVAMIVISKIDYNVYKKWSYLGFIITLALMIAVLIPGLGVEVKGATRWLGIGSFTLQPSEIMKIVLVMATSTYIALNTNKIINIQKVKDIRGYIPIVLMLIVVAVVMYLQNHLSGTAVMGVAVVAVVFAAGTKINAKFIIMAIILIVLAGLFFIFGDAISFENGSITVGESFRLNRILAFLNPEEDLQGTNWQAAQSLYAIGTGSVFGLGLGQSRQKYLWLPEAQNDFIFSVLGEELGLIGTISTIALFGFFIYRGLYIAMKSEELYAALLATGIISVYAFQIIVNIAVVTCSMPVTGMPLPFFSYGGTALFINLASMGILLNISRSIKKE